MKSIYFETDDILQIRVSDKPIVREVSQNWHTNITPHKRATLFVADFTYQTKATARFYYKS